MSKLPYFITVRVGDIKIPDWLLAHCSDIKLQMMKASIEEYGLVHYPLCYKDENGNISLLDGFARLRALGDECHTIVQCNTMTEDEAIRFYVSLSQTTKEGKET